MRGKQLRFVGYCLVLVLVAVLAMGVAACSSPTTTSTVSTTSANTTIPITSTTSIIGNTTPTAAPKLSSIAVTPASQQANLGIGANLQFTATGTFADGSTKDISSEVTWVSSDTNIATIDSNGLASGVAAGNTDITAALSSVTSPAVTLTVMTPIPPLTSITVTPMSPDNTTGLGVGSTQRFIATGNYSDGSTRDISSIVTWNSSKTTVASIDSDGLATGVAAGSTDITAARSGITSSAVTITVIASTTTTTTTK